MDALLVAAGAAVGAPLRWWVDVWVQRRWTPLLPWGTFTVNVTGSFLLGLLAAWWSTRDDGLLLLGVGVCGGLTTFSSFGWETHRLAEDGATRFAALNVVLTVVVCLLAAAAGWWLAGI